MHKIINIKNIYISFIYITNKKQQYFTNKKELMSSIKKTKKKKKKQKCNHKITNINNIFHLTIKNTYISYHIMIRIKKKE
ncbi:hypothetical protein PFNF135_04492 [Plasmodium falciparum NF135/5.C10]|uniref:Uncharacterized protein n=1 Tax=Plasmodium falciparum NF135/5.C10 TaxID=1036726 RepID=W4IBS8_PLAFA|nr:hypothetical protein PFNF135_04492 [Plasmodium falciparum NF135/5.C10]